MTTQTKPDKAGSREKPTRAQAAAAEALLHRAKRGRGADTPEIREIAETYKVRIAS